MEFEKALTKEQKRKQKLEKLLKKYGHLLSIPAGVLPLEHKAPLGGGLKCFQKIYQRKNGKKIKNLPKIRCTNPAVKGSFFCKKHGGGNTHAMVHGKRRMSSITGGLYGRGMQQDFSNLLEEFLNDPKMVDLRPELAALRLALSEYMSELTSGEPKQSPKRLIKYIKDITESENTNYGEKFVLIRDLCASQSFLTDGDSLDRLYKIIETISRVAERMHKIQMQDNYILTPDGLKVFLRSIVDLLKQTIPDPDILKEIQEKLLEISMQTKGNIHDVGRKNVNIMNEKEDMEFQEFD